MVESGVHASEVPKESFVVFQDGHGMESRATLLRMTRHLVVFEVYSPATVLHVSEVLTDFRISLEQEIFFAGKAVLTGVVNAGAVCVCEAQLDDGWIDNRVLWALGDGGALRRGFDKFVHEWQKLYRVRPEFKAVVADIHAFLTDIRLWLEQIELAIRSAPGADRLRLEQDVAQQLSASSTPTLNALFDQFEAAAQGIEPEFLPGHRSFCRKQLHPLLLASPFLYRTFTKPLGFAGDYEMVNMIMRDPCEGPSLFAKLLNAWFLQQVPADAHRNRIKHLVEQIASVCLKAKAAGRKARMLNLACGPAHEVQQLIEQGMTDNAHFTLIDFNEETLEHAQSRLSELANRTNRQVTFEFVKKSVNHLLKESAKSVGRSAASQYDLVYCAGLFDYLTDSICRRLSSTLFDFVAPGGTLLTTNVDASNPRRTTMDLVMDWHLIYRTNAQLMALKPDQARAEQCMVRSDLTGVNLYAETRKVA